MGLNEKSLLGKVNPLFSNLPICQFNYEETHLTKGALHWFVTLRLHVTRNNMPVKTLVYCNIVAVEEIFQVDVISIVWRLNYTDLIKDSVSGCEYKAESLTNWSHKDWNMRAFTSVKLMSGLNNWLRRIEDNFFDTWLILGLEIFILHPLLLLNDLYVSTILNCCTSPSKI